MTDVDITFNYLQGIFWANFGLNLTNATVSEKEIDMAKEVSERLLEQYWISLKSFTFTVVSGGFFRLTAASQPLTEIRLGW